MAVMKDKIIGDLNALFRARAEFYAFFDAQIPKFAGTQLFDFKALRASGRAFGKGGKNGANLAENSAYSAASGEKCVENLTNSISNCGENGENSANLVSSCGENSATNSANSATNSAQSVNLEQIYRLFHHYDYAIRKLLPSIYKAYEIDSERDLSKDF